MTYELTGMFVLPEDVVLIPVAELSAGMRERLNCDDGDVAVTRPRARRPSSIVDANSARLLQLFRSSKSVVEAVVEYSRAANADPRVVLERAFPLVERLVLSGVLLPTGDERARAIKETLRTGDQVGEFTLLDLVQLLEDVELHRARDAHGRFAAIKIARSGYFDRLRPALDREAHVLGMMEGRGAPLLRAIALDATRPYLAMSWCAGVPPLRAAEEFRPGDTRELRERILDLCVRIASAYASLHERGVLHGDVHDRNVLVEANGAVTLIDFGLAWTTSHQSDTRVTRGGVAAYYDPQLAAAFSDNTLPLALNAAAEQYSIAALLYHIASGEPYLALSVKRAEALRQIVEDPPLPFSDRQGMPWPELEHVLGRALSKDPASRYESVRELAGTLRDVSPATPSATTDENRSARRVGRTLEQRRRFVDAVFGRLDLDGALFRDGLPIAPYASVNNGAAGIAYAHYRCALARDDAAMLSRAEAWSWRARQWSSNPEAFYTADKLLTNKSVGAIALYHTMTGVECVDALIGLAAGDTERASRAGDAFVTAASMRSKLIDLTLGQAGVLLGGMLMLEASPDRLSAVHQHCRKVALTLDRKLRSFGPVTAEPRLSFTGIAHGWAGILLTLLRWKALTGVAADDVLRGRVDELAVLATPRGRGLAWLWNIGARTTGAEPHPSPSWCNGTAGHVHLWLAAHTAFGDARYAALAEAAGWNVWDDSRDNASDACCGMTGRAYALLALHRATGGGAWKQRADALADRAMLASTPDSSTSHRLYKGALGVALLLDELNHAPSEARMPLFESEGWTWR